jgi:hypothetical protein
VFFTLLPLYYGNISCWPLIIHQVSDKIPSLFAGTVSNDRYCTHEAALVDRYFISRKGEESGTSTSIILT